MGLRERFFDRLLVLTLFAAIAEKPCKRPMFRQSCLSEARATWPQLRLASMLLDQAGKLSLSSIAHGHSVGEGTGCDLTLSAIFSHYSKASADIDDDRGPGDGIWCRFPKAYLNCPGPERTGGRIVRFKLQATRHPPAAPINAACRIASPKRRTGRLR